MSSVPTPSASRQWDAIASRPAVPSNLEDQFASQTPTGSSSQSLGRGGALDFVQGIETGKCVVVLTRQEAVSSLCCAPIGGTGKLACFKPVRDCAVNSHGVGREKGRDQFGPGIYLIAPGDRRVFCQPVGELDLMKAHGNAILECEEENLSSWPALVNSWRRSEDSDAAAKMVDVAKRAREMQTPAKQPCEAPTELDFASPSAGFNGGDLRPLLVQYEDLLRYTDASSGQTDFLPSPEDLDLAVFLHAQFTRSTTLEETVTQLNHGLHMNKTWVDSDMEATNMRITDLEIGLGCASFPWEYGSTIWGSMETIGRNLEQCARTTALDEVVNDVSIHEAEFSKVFEVTSALKLKVDAELSAVSSRLDVISESTSNKDFDSTSIFNTLHALESRIVELENQRNLDRSEIERLQSGRDSGDASFEIDHEHSLRSAADVKAYLEKKGAPDIDFGGFCDVYTLLVRLQLKIDGAVSISEFLKMKKDARGIDLSDDETLVHYSFSSDAPPIFGGAKTYKSDIAKLQTYAAWRNKTSQSGMFFDFNSHLASATREVRTIVAQNYSRFPELNSLALTINATAQAFISTLVSFIDQTNDLLVDGGNDQADVWNLMAKVVRAIFEEGLGPFRTTPLGTSFSSSIDRTSVMLWGVIRTHIATERMLTKDLRDHHIVTGNYAKWLVNNSGKKDCAALKKQLDKLTNVVESVKESSATKKSVTAVEKIAEAAKKAADKALSKA